MLGPPTSDFRPPTSAIIAPMPTQAESAYESLLAQLREQALVASCQELLGWDELTRMPDGGTEYRGQQIAQLAGKHHELATDPRIGEWLDLAERSLLATDPLSDAAVNLREVRRQYNRLMRMPRGLVEELARLVTTGQREWKLAREADVLVAAFVNRAAVLAAVGAAPRIAIVCSGTDGRVTAEDALFAGSLIEALAVSSDQRTMNDQAALALSLWQSVWPATGNPAALAEAMGRMHGGRNLVRRDMADDILFCATFDRFSNVPRLDTSDWTIR